MEKNGLEYSRSIVLIQSQAADLTPADTQWNELQLLINLDWVDTPC